MITGGAITVVMTVVKIATVAGSGIALTTGYEWFHSYKFKSKKTTTSMREGGITHGHTETEDFRARARSTR